MRAFLAPILSLGLLAAPPEAGLHTLKSLPVAGSGGWDYVTLDSSAKRIYVPRSDRVMVMDLDGKPVGEIPGTDGVHGVALAPGLDRGFTSNGRSNTITIFKLSTLEVLSQVKATGEGPDAILFDPFTNRVFSFNGRGKNATVLDARSGAVVGTIPFGHKPEFAATDNLGRVFVNLEDSAEVAVIDATKLLVEKRWSLAPVEDPTGMAIDLKHHRLFIVGGNKLMAVVDSASGKVVATPAIGSGADAAAYDAELGLAFSSNGEGTLTVVRQENPDKYVPMAAVPTKKSARTMALDEKTHRIYLPAADFSPAPAPTPETPRPRPAMVPDSFKILVVGR
jgi:DNA-binding beta-propeller fold protein YncE